MSPNRFMRSFLVWFGFSASALLSVAQDVTMSDPVWIDQDDPPDQLPVLKRSHPPEFPRELLKTSDVGYALWEISLDEKGKVLAAHTYATNAWCKATVNGVDLTTWKFEPARRGGKGVNSRVRITVAFHPVGVSAKGPDASPRLLRATIVVDPKLPPKPRYAAEPEVVWAAVKVSAAGDPLGVDQAPKSLGPILSEAVAEWRFAPARRGGAAVEATLAIPFIVRGPEMNPSPGQTMPAVKRRVPPVYPIALRRAGVRGHVDVMFIVDVEGRVRSPLVTRSLNPFFNGAAVAAIRQWQFEPGMVDGVPVPTAMMQPISFSLEGEPEGGGSGLEVRQRGNLSKLPPELRYDTPPQLETMAVPRYPYALLRDRKRGSAQVSLVLDPDGRVIASKVVKASHPEFGYALQAAADLFRFRPALKDGRPIPSVHGWMMEFSPQDDSLVWDFDKAALEIERKHSDRLLGAGALDRPLRPISDSSPTFPRGVAATVEQGEAKVEFMVDEEGQVCLPRVVTASDPEFGYAAVQAVGQWRFAPPVIKGKRGSVRVVVPFQFSRRASGESANKS